MQPPRSIKVLGDKKPKKTALTTLSKHNISTVNIAIKDPAIRYTLLQFLYYPKATMLKTSANNATVSQRPTTVMYCEKPFPVSAKASAPAAPALP